MAIYRFETQDGQVVRKMFAMGECPEEIITDTGKVAKRVLTCNISMFSKQGSAGSRSNQLNKQMRKRNEQAGKRMRERWKSVKSDK